MAFDDRRCKSFVTSDGDCKACSAPSLSSGKRRTDPPPFDNAKTTQTLPCRRRELSTHDNLYNFVRTALCLLTLRLVPRRTLVLQEQGRIDGSSSSETQGSECIYMALRKPRSQGFSFRISGSWPRLLARVTPRRDDAVARKLAFLSDMKGGNSKRE